MINILNYFFKLKKCNGIELKNGKLQKCLNSTNNEFCNLHKIRYRFKKDNCSICFEDINNIEIPLSCGHWFHKNCLKFIKNYKCPLCRNRMNNTDIQYIYGIDTYINDKMCISIIIILFFLIIPVFILIVLTIKLENLYYNFKNKIISLFYF